MFGVGRGDDHAELVGWAEADEFEAVAQGRHFNIEEDQVGLVPMT
jgi:hypothetical protein